MKIYITIANDEDDFPAVDSISVYKTKEGAKKFIMKLMDYNYQNFNILEQTLKD